MDQIRWTNQSHPQTLQVAVFLLYIDAFFSLLNGGAGFLLAIAFAAGGVGIANNHKLGYWGAVLVSSIYPFFIGRILWRDGLDELFDPRFLLAIVFPIAQLALLLHTMSRNHVRIWFNGPSWLRR